MPTHPECGCTLAGRNARIGRYLGTRKIGLERGHPGVDQQDRFILCGTSENSAAAMSLIQKARNFSRISFTPNHFIIIRISGLHLVQSGRSPFTTIIPLYYPASLSILPYTADVTQVPGRRCFRQSRSFRRRCRRRVLALCKLRPAGPLPKLKQVIKVNLPKADCSSSA